MKSYSELGKKAKSKEMKGAKLTRIKNAKEKGTVALMGQKAREKAYKKAK
jgi:hypothetical protein